MLSLKALCLVPALLWLPAACVPTGTPSAPASASASAPAAPAGPDGRYTCRAGQGFGNSCTEPLVAASHTWTLELAGQALTVQSAGFDQPRIACIGTWTGDRFVCRPSWTRAGRDCSLPFHLERSAPDTLSFWIGSSDGERASCRKS